jgi:hypothetical protein
MAYLNQHSFLISAGVLILAFALLLLRGGFDRNSTVALLALIAGFVLAYAWLQPGEGTHTRIDQIEAETGAGTPVLLEFQSRY